MGKLIHLFRGNNNIDENLSLSRDQVIKLRLIENTVSKLRREEEDLRCEIERKCKDELDGMQRLSLKIQELELESEGIKNLGKARIRNNFPTGFISEVNKPKESA
ncbi:MAG: hypothetical protein HQM10_15065 [Candidatus Riflebacteria bacterium]|nr:hypothetical protein [Candidatus Riflebacteria bacterium]